MLKLKLQYYFILFLMISTSRWVILWLPSWPLSLLTSSSVFHSTSAICGHSSDLLFNNNVLLIIVTETLLCKFSFQYCTLAIPSLTFSVHVFWYKLSFHLAGAYIPLTLSVLLTISHRSLLMSHSISLVILNSVVSHNCSVANTQHPCPHYIS